MTEETFDPVMCKKGLHHKDFPWGPCKGCEADRKRRARRRAKARYAAGFVDYDAMRQAPDWIPTAALLPIIDAYLQSNMVDDLAAAMKVPLKTLERWRSGESKHARLDLVDRMLCAMDQTYHFYTTLEKFYFADLIEAEVHVAA